MIALAFALAAANQEGQSADYIIFPHELHVEDLEISCMDCHTTITASTKSSDHNIPTMDDCGTCHDVEDVDNCGLCHSNADEPSGSSPLLRGIEFDHSKHDGDDFQCHVCHGSSESSEKRYIQVPSKPLCMRCHDGESASWDCALCHEQSVSLIDIHPLEWVTQHADEASLRRDWCETCHRSENYCQDCHEGDNLSGITHSLDYSLTHGLDAASKEIDCSQCHDSRQFCNECHVRELRLPWQHSTITWLMDHGDAARDDIENCASCHDEQDPTCSRAGCHVDRDGLAGTDPAIHPQSMSRFDRSGPWHDDKSYFCFQCHTDSGQSGIGFCGYCHD